MQSYEQLHPQVSEILGEDGANRERIRQEIGVIRSMFGNIVNMFTAPRDGVENFFQKHFLGICNDAGDLDYQRILLYAYSDWSNELREGLNIDNFDQLHQQTQRIVALLFGDDWSEIQQFYNQICLNLTHYNALLIALSPKISTLLRNINENMDRVVKEKLLTLSSD